MRAHGHARGHVVSTDGRHGHGFLPVAGGRHGHGVLLAGMDIWSLYLHRFCSLPYLALAKPWGALPQGPHAAVYRLLLSPRHASRKPLRLRARTAAKAAQLALAATMETKHVVALPHDRDRSGRP
ncbi:hypothetical protein SEVIR_5G029250v4 [Setaria viridis]